MTTEANQATWVTYAPVRGGIVMCAYMGTCLSSARIALLSVTPYLTSKKQQHISLEVSWKVLTDLNSSFHLPYNPDPCKQARYRILLFTSHIIQILLCAGWQLQIGTY
jgi:hypothetical protein